LADAAETYRRALARVERPDWMADLGDVYRAMGRRQEANMQYRAAENWLESRMDDPAADAGHQLAQFLADRGRKPERALKLALQEAESAQDIAACDTLAWSLHHAGRSTEAWKHAARALRLGTREPKLLYHAGMIACRIPERRAEGRRFLREALALNPNWHPLDAPAARRALSAVNQAHR
jgi:Flp pilus assembly protein TadD